MPNQLSKEQLGFLLGRSIMIFSMTHERKTVLMIPNTGRNVVWVLLDTNDKRKVVAADTGVEKLSYSSKKGEQRKELALLASRV